MTDKAKVNVNFYVETLTIGGESKVGGPGQWNQLLLAR